MADSQSENKNDSARGIARAIAALPPLREVIRAAGLDARKKLGQNFIFDLNLTARIARAAASPPAAIPKGGTVIEIGPGPGGLTRALLADGSAAKVIAIETDPRAVAALAPLVAAAQGRLRVIEADALKTDIADLPDGEDDTPAQCAPGKCTIVANLPYNIATPLLLHWLDRLDRIASMTLMFQKEVAARITAAPNTPAYGRLAVLCGWLCEARILFDIPPDAFVPPPKVTSSLVRLTPRATPLCGGLTAKPALEETTRVLFGQRRKMLRASVKNLPGADDPAKFLEKAGIDGTRRPETLTIEEFCTLARLAYETAR